MTAIGDSPLARRLRDAATRFTTPLLPDDYLTLVNPLWSARELRGRIVSVTPEAEDTATLVVEPGWGWSFTHAAGQYIGIGVQIDGRFVWRSYSLTTPPSRDGRRLVVTVRAMPEGFASRHLVHGVAPGTIVRLAPPAGEFVLPDPLPDKVLMLTAGSGITPIMAMLRTLDRRGGSGSLHDVTVVHCAPDAERALFADELDLLARRHPDWRIVSHHTATAGRLALRPAPHEGNPRPGRATGSSPRTSLDDLVPDWRERETWACGPAAMLDDAEKLWADAGLTDALHLERFAASFSADAASSQGGTITFARSGRTVEADGATTVLDAGERAGIPMPFGCRMGICHTCVAPLRSGAVRDLRDGTEARVAPTDQATRTVQTCVSAASGDCVIDL
ncbi:ferredoxin reductase [Actinomycetospora endophytica]|uniref:Ferredoxin reductase n=1 Tax=Actinomycetospora endophytica TaxID=2291215 RepID=A0ABS8PED0_9PSEU|nr:ferredoxin reductase [Actinomycetospora endophytica]MCD2196630.1 ferredoxin reductase [Actinomycetospora endophytica]